MMKKYKLLLPLGILFLAALPGQATPFQPTEVSQDANWYVHADLESMRDSQIGEIMMKVIEEKHGHQLKAVKRMFSLNPFTDLEAITLWGPGEKDQGVAMIRGSFDRAHLEDLIGASDEHKVSTHHSHSVHTWKDKKKTQHGAFFGNDLAVMGEQKKLVLRALDVLDKRSASMKAPAQAGDSAILIGLANLEGIELKGDEAKMIEKAKALRGRMFEKMERLHLEVEITAKNSDDARRFHEALEGLIAMGQLANEDLAGLQLESEVRVSDDVKVTATLSVANDKILKLIEEAGE